MAKRKAFKDLTKKELSEILNKTKKELQKLEKKLFIDGIKRENRRKKK